MSTLTGGAMQLAGQGHKEAARLNECQGLVMPGLASTRMAARAAACIQLHSYEPAPAAPHLRDGDCRYRLSVRLWRCQGAQCYQLCAKKL